jgi:hypothetical protein
MMRAFYLVAIVFSLIFCVVAFTFAAKVSSDRFASFMSDLSTDYSSDYGSYNSYSYDDYGAESDTRTGAILSILFLVVFETVFLLGLLKVKTKTVKVTSIIGLSLNFIFLIWAVMVMGNPGSMSFDEVGAGFGLYALVPLAFSIIGVIHAFRVKA